MKAKASDGSHAADQPIDHRVSSPRAEDIPRRAEFVRQGILKLVRNGHLRVGDKLPSEPQLSETFGVGRSSVREAVQALIGMGMVEMRPGRGAFLRQLSTDSVAQLIDGTVELEREPALHLHEVRSMMEVFSAKLAAARHTQQDLEQLGDAIIEYRVAFYKKSHEGMIDADIAFHRALVRSTHNEILIKVFDSLDGLLREHRRQYGAPHEITHGDLVISEHESILNTIAQSDPKDAEEVMTRHMRHVEQAIDALTGGSDQSSQPFDTEDLASSLR